MIHAVSLSPSLYLNRLHPHHSVPVAQSVGRKQANSGESLEGNRSRRSLNEEESRKRRELGPPYALLPVILYA